MSLPDLEKFDGSKPFHTWRMQVYSKLSADGHLIGNARNQMFHLMVTLTGNAADYMTPWMARNVLHTETLLVGPQDFIAHLALGFEDPYYKDDALQKLTSIKQTNKPFPAFLNTFNQLLYASGEHEAHDAVKIMHIKNALSGELLRAQSLVGDLPTVYEAYTGMLYRQWAQIQQVKSMEQQKTNGGQHHGQSRGGQQHNQIPQLNRTQNLAPQAYPATTSQSSDAMDLSAGTTRAGTTNVRNPGDKNYPRAQWVTPDILNARKQNRTCLRCGNAGHMIPDCKFQPPQNPNYVPRVNATRANTAPETFTPTRANTVAEATTSDNDSLNSTP
jgi:hypothetical protein